MCNFEVCLTVAWVQRIYKVCSQYNIDSLYLFEEMSLHFEWSQFPERFINNGCVLPVFILKDGSSGKGFENQTYPL